MSKNLHAQLESALGFKAGLIALQVSGTYLRIKPVLQCFSSHGAMNSSAPSFHPNTLVDSFAL